MSGITSSLFLDIVLEIIQLLRLFFYGGPLPSINLKKDIDTSYTAVNSKQNADISTRYTAENSKLKDEISRLISEILNSKGDNYNTTGLTADIMTEISKLKDDIARLTAEISKSKVDSTVRLTTEISNLKDDISTRHTAEILKVKDVVSTRVTADISNLKDDMSTRLTADIMTEISKLKDDISTTITTDISKLKDDISTTVTADILKLKDDISTTRTADISKLKEDISTTITTDISKIKDDIATTVTTDISKLKGDISTTVTAEISKLKNDIATTRTAEREEMKNLEQLFKQYKEDEALVKSSSFALINPRPIFPTLPQEAFSASSSWVGDGNSPFGVSWKIVHMPFNSILNKASKRQETCWATVAANTPNSFIQVNLGQLYLVNEIQTRGRGGAEHKQWVKTYKVGYVHHEQKVEVALLNLENGNMFDGNYSETEITSNKYFKPFIAQYIKLYPVEYNNHQSLNWEVIGVPLSKIDEKGLKMFLTSSVK
jgi:hypothetical protein